MEGVHDVSPDAQLVRAADANFVAAMERFAASAPRGTVRRFGAVPAVATGIPYAFFNAAFVTTDEARPGDVTRAAAWLRSAGVPFVLHVHEDLRPSLVATVDRLGLDRERSTLPAMALSPIGEGPPSPPGLTIEPVGMDGLAVHQALLAEIFHMPARVVRDLMSASGLGADGFVAFTGRLTGRPVATSAALMTGDVVGIYGVGTVEGARRQGIGAAMTWRAIRAGVDAGCTVAILQSSAMGYAVYRAMGFRPLVSYLEYVDRPVR